MNRRKIKKIEEKKVIGIKFRYYVDFLILICCTIIAFNVHPSNVEKNKMQSLERQTMIYVFHDYDGNEYVMNDQSHGSSDSWDYLFNDEIPGDLKGEERNASNVGDKNRQDVLGKNDSEYIKDNQISFEDIVSELSIDDKESGSGAVIINISDTNVNLREGEGYYTVEEKTSIDGNSLIVEKIDDKVDGNDVSEYNNLINNNSERKNLSIAKTFTFIEEGRVLPILSARNDLIFENMDQNIAYATVDGKDLKNSNSINQVSKGSKGIIIIDDYADCMTPWGYTILHGDSVLAYQQIPDTPDICNIERRFCWKGKLSGTYTQQGCSVNTDYTYEQFGGIPEQTIEKDDGFRGGVRQNPDGTITVKDSGNLGRSITENSVYTNFSEGSNIRDEEPALEQSDRYYPDCTTPWGEKVKHGYFVQAFKHANGFNDSPCEAQIRLCSMGELMGTYTEVRCKTRDTSFIDWVNGSPTWETYSQEKLDLVRKQIKAEEKYYNNARKDAEKTTNSNALDRILYILDQD